MQAATIPPAQLRPVPFNEPHWTVCAHCARLVVTVEVATGPRGHGPVELVIADGYEWEPRGRCQLCVRTRAAHPTSHVNCARCNDSGYVGSQRPAGLMLAIDIAWSDEGHCRIIGPNTSRNMGEALFPLHACSVSGRLAA